MPGPLDALKNYLAPAGGGTPDSPYAPWQRTAQEAFEGTTSALKGLIGIGDDSRANAAGQFLSASAPILGGIKGTQFWHDIPDLEKIAGGAGDIRLYHGAPNDAVNSMLQNGIKLPPSGEASAQAMAQRYGIPWTEWKSKEPWSGYSDETSRLSTAPYPIAARWAKNFPQGEVNSQLNMEARIMAEAKRQGIPYDDMYEQVFNTGHNSGVKSSYQYPDAAGLPDLMKPQEPGGAVLGVDTDVRAIKPMHQKDAEWMLNHIDKGNIDLFNGLKEWNNQYRDIKIAPQNVKGLEVVQRFPRGSK